MKFARLLLCSAFVCGTCCLAVGVDAAWPPGAQEQPAEETRPVPYTASEQVARLHDVLERYREIESRGGWKKVPTDLVMGPEYSYECSRIFAIEKRMMAEGYLDRRDATRPPPEAPPPPPPSRWSTKKEPPPPPPAMCQFSRELTEAVRAFQQDRKVLGYGQVGKLTMAEMNRPVQEIISVIQHDLGRWRSLPLEDTGNYIVVNIPFYELSVFEAGREKMRMPVIVGQRTWQTPTFSAAVRYLILNPDWGIPDKIAKLEYLPSARRNPKWLAAQGISNAGGSLRQKPGPQNPLGRIKFVMPNEHDVYLHDTPAKGAFNAAVKALSHGCVRVKHPLDLAEYLLRDDPSWSRHRIESEIATGKTEHVDLLEPMPVHILYVTSRVNDAGRLEIRPDVYGRNRAEEAQRGPADESIESWP